MPGDGGSSLWFGSVKFKSNEFCLRKRLPAILGLSPIVGQNHTLPDLPWVILRFSFDIIWVNPWWILWCRGYPESDDETDSDETPHVRGGDGDSAEKQHFLEVCPLSKVEGMHKQSISSTCWYQIFHLKVLCGSELPWCSVWDPERTSRTNPRYLWSCSRKTGHAWAGLVMAVLFFVFVFFLSPPTGPTSIFLFSWERLSEGFF